jgi:hypothetical protein
MDQLVIAPMLGSTTGTSKSLIGWLVARTTVGEGYIIGAAAAGAASFMVIITSAVADPPELDAVTVYFACAADAVGVPEMAPDVVFSIKPAGNAGLTT